MAQDLFDTFPKADKGIWVKSAEEELGGANPFDKLTKVIDGVEAMAYYDASDMGSTPDFTLPVSQNQFLGPRTWHNMPLVKVLNANIANKVALAHLAAGADGVLFELESNTNIEELLADIELPHCSTFFLVDSEHSGFLSELEQFSNAKNFDVRSITGGAIWKSIPKNQSEIAKLFQNWDHFFVLGHRVSEIAPIEAIVDALMKGADSIDVITNSVSSTENAINCQAFSFEIGNNFFIEIAKLKAFRRLWTLLVSAYGAKNENLGHPFVHGFSSAWKNTSYDPNANMLKSTTAAIASIVGGCDGITIAAEEQDHEVQNRIARNVSSILREESHLNRTADPTAGAYYIEKLMDEMAEKAWTKFKEKISK